jgi:hypothetical protein
MISHVQFFLSLFIAAISTSHSESVSLYTRQDQVDTVCGYNTGNPDQPVLAPSGYHCTYDHFYGLWGLCTNTLSSGASCELFGRCADSYVCQTGCGIPTDITGIATVSW